MRLMTPTDPKYWEMQGWEDGFNTSGIRHTLAFFVAAQLGVEVYEGYRRGHAQGVRDHSAFDTCWGEC